MTRDVHVIGAGLAGSEASYQLAKRGFHVHLYEMRPIKTSPAHTSGLFAELVCSNSFRANSLENAVGVLKQEMRELDSLIIRIADQTQVPAGGALAVDRTVFAQGVTEALQANPNITIHNEEITTIPDGPTIIATGPLTSDALSASIRALVNEDYLFFFDAAAPIVTYESIDLSKAYKKSRYDKGEAAYINCPMTEEQFNHWYDELVAAKTVELRDFELKVFEGCMPFEEMARRGRQTLLFGPMKPVGLEQPDGTRPYAVVQLRQDNLEGTLYNIVGFQTHLTFGEQKRLIRMIPGLEQAEIVRYGVMHRNTFLHSPRLLTRNYRFRERQDLYFAGQITGVEGYVESAGSGLLAAISLARQLAGQEEIIFPASTILGSQSYYISHASISDFQPMNANFGIVEPLKENHKKRDRKRLYGERAIDVVRRIAERIAHDDERETP
jgi:methylenetetrahydrofolate--tRNA-(uracil-5-)-methyltransferase